LLVKYGNFTTRQIRPQKSRVFSARPPYQHEKSCQEILAAQPSNP
jgi:hypothetical protein